MTGSHDDADDRRTDSPDPGVPTLGSDEQPAIYVPDHDADDVTAADGGGRDAATTATDGGTAAADPDPMDPARRSRSPPSKTSTAS